MKLDVILLQLYSPEGYNFLWSYLLSDHTAAGLDLKRISFLTFCVANRLHSKAQLLQDLYVLHKLNSKRNGYFVEFGATNGVDLSNSYLLEKQLGWNGILAEPFPIWHEDLAKNRSAIIDHRCVWAKSNQTLKFLTAEHAPEYASLYAMKDNDVHAGLRNQSTKTIDVTTISLNDMLEQHNAPTDFDYLSVDTEGAELEILKHFNFSKYHPKIITVEHNHGSELRTGIYELLTRHGYVREFEDFSFWDDWYYLA
jgi:FkbM family methyltransferase